MYVNASIAAAAQAEAIANAATLPLVGVVRDE